MQQQKSLADLKKKNAQLRKKDRRKKRAFRQKTQPILDTASSFANHQVVQTQVKQISKTAGELFSAVHDQTAKRQARDSAEDKKKAELKMVEKQMETALLHNEQMGLYEDRGKQFRAVKTEEVLNSSKAAFKKLGKAAEGLSEAKQKALKTFTEEYIKDQRMLKDLQDRLAAAENAGDRATVDALRGEIQKLDKNIGDKMEEAKRNIGEVVEGVLQSLDEQKAALKNLSDEISALDNTMKEGFQKIMGALKKALEAAYTAQPCLANEQHIPLYWCINQVNYCRGAKSPNIQKIAGRDCFMLDDRINSITGLKFTTHAPYFCHEGKNSRDFGEQEEKKTDFSELFKVPKSVLYRLLSPESEGGRLGVYFGGWTDIDLTYDFPFKKGDVGVTTDNREYYLQKIRGALKVYFPNESTKVSLARADGGEVGATAYNRLLYLAIQDALTYVIENGCDK